ncbi:double-cubane-cluster-containing anaerobic reductase [Desulfonatronum thioautotrophicum]|uniref:double-cubane-cluster-containing anaerobic reductase n=1 Tax=Desulfonatronum thioautotrophicum TaxID=617001 RepID=UPI0005EBB1FC|nr:double-cubane-cluster-containing anaerobic reductase [Desulfonatronum thioautotrophicum]
MTTPKPPCFAQFENWAEKSLLDLDTARREGVKIAGVFCTYAPLELVRAAGAVPVSLCGKRQDPISAAERQLPANLCPLIKSSYGYAVTDTCPFLAASDFILGETTCDGKKKMFELLQKIKPLHLLHLPYLQDDETALTFWMDQIRRMQAFLEQTTGQLITPDRVRQQIHDANRVRELLKKIAYMASDHPVPLSGQDAMRVFESSSFVVNLTAFTELLETLLQELAVMKAQGISVCPADAPRILLTGCPVGKGSDKVLKLIEDSGAVVVCLENCTGFKNFDLLVEESGDPFEALARRYLRIPCSCMSPNQGRFELISRLTRDFKVQGIVDQTWQCCHTYNVEAHGIKNLAEQSLNIPFLHIETDYSESDTEQLRTRIEAFLEVVAMGRPL